MLFFRSPKIFNCKAKSIDWFRKFQPPTSSVCFIPVEPFEEKRSLLGGMGRKGGGGGTAGGGRNGSRGNVTYSRVIPKFLQGLVADRDSDDLDAKRSSATSHLGIGVERKRKQDDPNTHGKSRNHEEEIAKLEAAGFKVVTEGSTAKVIDDVEDSEKAGQSGHQREGEVAGIIRRRKVGLRSIEKKRRGVEPAGAAFRVNNRQKLSFGGGESDDSDV